MNLGEKNNMNKLIIAVVLFLLFGLMACSVEPQKIKIGKDACSFCKMSIADKRFGAEILTKKGKVYLFDDVHCLLEFIKTNTIQQSDIKETYFVGFENPHELIEAPKVFLLKSNELHSPMGGNIAVFMDQNKRRDAAAKFNGEEITWEALLKANQ